MKIPFVVAVILSSLASAFGQSVTASQAASNSAPYTANSDKTLRAIIAYYTTLAATGVLTANQAASNAASWTSLDDKQLAAIMAWATANGVLQNGVLNSNTSPSVDFINRKLFSVDGSEAAEWGSPSTFIPNFCAVSGSFANNGNTQCGDDHGQWTSCTGAFYRTNGTPSPFNAGFNFTPAGNGTEGWTLINTNGHITGSNSVAVVSANAAMYDIGGEENNFSGSVVQTNMSGFVNGDTSRANAVRVALSFNNNVNVVNGRKYKFILTVYMAESVAGEGFSIDFTAGSATAANFRAHAMLLHDTGGTTNLTAATSTSLAGVINQAQMANANQACLLVEGTLEPSASGTFGPKIAQNTHSSGTLSIFRGSNLVLTQLP